jgi:peptidoglycan/xylan/chitin deacetylase (PgdA/CDA1 family)
MPKFPGPTRPRRFRLRRSSSYPSTSYGGQLARRPADGSGPSLTRRGVLGALVVVAVASTVDAVRVVVAGGSTARAAGGPPGLPPRLVNLLTGNIRPEGAPASARPTESASPAASPIPQRGSHHRTGHPHGSSPSGQHLTRRQRQRLAREHVTLPPAQLQVRNQPAYRLDQLIQDPPEQAIALTIDDGPDPQYTPAVLRLLDKYQTQASFCVIGVHADAYPRLIRDITRAGHVVVNHSYTHMLPFNTLPEKRIVAEITRTQRAIERAAGVTPQLFRAPGGDWSRFILRACASYGLEPLDWDLDPRDWTRPGTKKIIRRMLQARPGEIVLCHDGGGNRIETVRALRRVLPTWQQRGLLTVPLQIQPH